MGFILLCIINRKRFGKQKKTAGDVGSLKNTVSGPQEGLLSPTEKRQTKWQRQTGETLGSLGGRGRKLEIWQLYFFKKKVWINYCIHLNSCQLEARNRLERSFQRMLCSHSALTVLWRCPIDYLMPDDFLPDFWANHRSIKTTNGGPPSWVALYSAGRWTL